MLDGDWSSDVCSSDLTGLRLARGHIPLVLLLLLFNIGGVISLIPYMDQTPSVRFIAVSIYLMFTCIFFAGLMSDDAVGRLEAMRRGFLPAAWIAAIAGIIGYFNIAGTQEYFTLYNRASGTFKDANVFGPFLVIPVVYALQRVLCGETGAIRGFLSISVPLFGIFLSFSRGAWGNFIGASLLTVALLFLTSDSDRLRARIVALAGASLGIAVAALLVALSFESIREVFEVRASLNQSYDIGETGRFGNQLRSLPLLLEAPNGFGPLRFRFYFPEDPHNVYINAFASYGWLGGLSYLTLIITTCFVGWALVFRRSPLQRHAIVLWSVLFVTILQGVQIDTDHWRHFYLLVGLVWGLAARPIVGYGALRART
jgi:hypothetical protein